MLDSEALTMIQTIILVAIIVIASLGGGVAYVLLSKEEQTEDTIKIGVCADLDMLAGRSTWEGVILAAEQINNQGGVLGKDVEVMAEDSDGSSLPLDIGIGAQALTRLITFHKVDFLITCDGLYQLTYQDIVAEHEKILFGIYSLSNELTERVEDNYQKFKYFFRTSPNATHALLGMADCLDTLRGYSGFNKVAWLGPDLSYYTDFLPIITNYLSEVLGFQIVYQSVFPSDIVDFSSYLAAVESSGAEILVPFVAGQEGIVLLRDWYDRQSPFVLWGLNAYAGEDNAWEVTDGKCEHTSNVGYPTVAGYPLTSVTIPFREAYIERWGEIPYYTAAFAYDTIRFILYEAIKKVGTTETEAVIAALEETEVETSLAENFVFTSSSHDVMGGENINNPDEDFMVVMLFQWQNGKQVPMYPKSVKEEAGATYTFPDWPGPWDE